jgi:hypothetical protein
MMSRFRSGAENGFLFGLIAWSLGCSSPPANDSQAPPWPIQKIGPQLYSVKAQAPSGVENGFDRAERVAVLEAKHYCASRSLAYQYFMEERMGVQGTPQVTSVTFRCVAKAEQASQ